MNIKEVTIATGVSSRTLRYYEEIGLLHPTRNPENDYREYQQKDLDTLHQILVYRSLNFPLSQIKQLLHQPSSEIFENQLTLLKKEAKKLQETITQLEKIVQGEKLSMKEQFKGLEDFITKNEKTYGKEIREKYGDEEIDASNDHLRKQGEEGLEKGEDLRLQINALLKELVNNSVAIDSKEAQELFNLHRAWLKIFYPKYSTPYHLGLASLYEADERFAKNYDDVVPGGMKYLVAVIRQFAQ